MNAPVPAIPAATVMLLRDGPQGVEVFMVRRPDSMQAFAGMLVFPGGKVDHADRFQPLREVSVGHEELDDEAMAFRACAVRETFEEAGVLFAYDEAGELLAGGDRLAHTRHHLISGDFGFIDVIDSFGVRLALDLLVPFARWIAPSQATTRFDTWFFLARLPADQDASHDGDESEHGVWIRPVDVLAEADKGTERIIFPTRMNLLRLARSETVAGAMMMARADGAPTVQPTVEVRPDGKYVVVPADVGYPITEMKLDLPSGR